MSPSCQMLPSIDSFGEVVVVRKHTSAAFEPFIPFMGQGKQNETKYPYLFYNILAILVKCESCKVAAASLW